MEFLKKFESQQSRLSESEFVQKAASTFQKEQKIASHVCRYTYVFKNDGTVPIKLILVHKAVTGSEIAEIVQDVSIVLSAGQERHIQFVKHRSPELFEVQMLFAWYDERSARWDFTLGGKALVFVPDPLNSPLGFDDPMLVESK